MSEAEGRPRPRPEAGTSMFGARTTLLRFHMRLNAHVQYSCRLACPHKIRPHTHHTRGKGRLRASEPPQTRTAVAPRRGCVEPRLWRGRRPRWGVPAASTCLLLPAAAAAAVAAAAAAAAAPLLPLLLLLRWRRRPSRGLAGGSCADARKGAGAGNGACRKSTPPPLVPLLSPASVRYPAAPLAAYAAEADALGCRQQRRSFTRARKRRGKEVDAGKDGAGTARRSWRSNAVATCASAITEGSLTRTHAGLPAEVATPHLGGETPTNTSRHPSSRHPLESLCRRPDACQTLLSIRCQTESCVAALDVSRMG
eukprot:351774-Chlamydomonas_euryale.AAC.1